MVGGTEKVFGGEKIMEILKNGYDKKYIHICKNCRSELIYERSDVSTYKGRRYVVCPVCKWKGIVNFTEYNNLRYIPDYPYPIPHYPYTTPQEWKP